MKNKVITLMILTILIAIIPINVFADYSGIDTDVTIGKTNAAVKSEPMISKMLGAFQIVGSVISVIALIIIGLRYMVSSAQEKANLKGILIYYIIGAVLVFATSNVLGIVYDVINGLKYNSGSASSTGSYPSYIPVKGNSSDNSGGGTTGGDSAGDFVGPPVSTSPTVPNNVDGCDCPSEYCRSYEGGCHPRCQCRGDCKTKSSSESSTGGGTTGSGTTGGGSKYDKLNLYRPLLD